MSQTRSFINMLQLSVVHRFTGKGFIVMMDNAAADGDNTERTSIVELQCYIPLTTARLLH